MNTFNHLVSSSNNLGYEPLLKRLEEISRLKEYVDSLGESVKLKTSKMFSTVFSELSMKMTKGKFQNIVNIAAKENNVNPVLVNAVIEKESKFNPNAISSSGAVGLMQLMPETARALGVKDLLNPVENIRAGTKYLSSLLNRYHGDVALALSAYNAGPGNVDKYKGIPPFKETKEYVEEIIKKIT